MAVLTGFLEINCSYGFPPLELLTWLPIGEPVLTESIYFDFVFKLEIIASQTIIQTKKINKGKN